MRNFWQDRKVKAVQARQFVEWYKRGGKMTDSVIIKNQWFLKWSYSGEDLLEIVHEALDFIDK